MKTFYQDEEIIFQTIFYEDRLKTTVVDPDDIELELEKPNGDTVTPTVEEDGDRPEFEGNYIASYVVEDYGDWAWRWITDNPRIVKQGVFRVVQNNQND